MNACAVQILVLAKQPIPGRVKTRLCPPCDPQDAALIAEAALVSTLAAVAATPTRRRVLVLDGPPARSHPLTFEVIPQRGQGLDERLASAFEDAGAPSLLIGMDTPQVQPPLLQHAMETLAAPGTDAVLGPTADGGYWAIGLRRADPLVFGGVPMSAPDTFERQADRLTSLRLKFPTLPPLVDVDRFPDALAVAEEIPNSGFADVVHRVAGRLEAIG